MARRKKRTGNYGLRLFKRPIFIKKKLEKEKRMCEQKDKQMFDNQPPL